MRNWWLVLCLAAYATAIGLIVGAALALAAGPCDGLSGNARAACECRVACLNAGEADGHVINGRCICDPSPRGTSCRTDGDCIGQGGTCRYPDGGAR